MRVDEAVAGGDGAATVVAEVDSRRWIRLVVDDVVAALDKFTS
jgi:hypothetical protein